MKKIILYGLLTLLPCSCAQAQWHFFGIIQDTDGYVNIRDTDKSVIDKLFDNHVFFDWDARTDEPDADWHNIEYGAETGITKCNDKNTKTGEIHKSRIRYLEDLPQLKKQSQSTDECLVYANDTLTVELRIRDFNPHGHKVVQGSQWLEIQSIDGVSDLWGVDNRMPRKEYASISIKHPEGTLNFPVEYFSHLYEPGDNILVSLGKGNAIFICTLNGDASYGYCAVWTVENYLVKSLFVLLGF
ncbi:MAG: hypothetical protein LUD46_11380 [Parabacteroides sp.]|nr:hypothetical protein [Parabacteroides sp.]